MCFRLVLGLRRFSKFIYSKYGVILKMFAIGIALKLALKLELIDNKLDMQNYQLA